MKTVVVLGGTGMLGNCVFKLLSLNKDIKCIAASRNYQNETLETKKIVITNLDSIEELFKCHTPQWVINCIADNSSSPGKIEEYFYVNSVFPQVLSNICEKYKCKLIHISSNAVFSGCKDFYKDTDAPDSSSLYGLSKTISENIKGIIIRTSIIGFSLNSKNHSLLNWFLQNKSKSVSGYSISLWNGISTLTLARIIENIIDRNLFADKTKTIIHLSSEVISKYELLRLFKHVFNKKIKIVKDDSINNSITLKPSSSQSRYFSSLVPPIRIQIKELKKFYFPNQ